MTGPAPDVAHATVQALVANASGGWDAFPASPSPFAADGTYSIPGVPIGPHVLVLVDGAGYLHAVSTPATTVDLGFDELGRAGAGPPVVNATPVEIDLSGLDPWNPAGDEVQITSSGADLWASLDATPLATTPGVTSGALTRNWGGPGVTPLNLLAAGDTLLVHQLAAAAVTVPAGTSAGTYSYQWMIKVAQVQGTVLADEPTTQVIPAPLLDPATTGSIAVSWDLPAFEALVPLMAPAPTTDAFAHTCLVGASAWPLTYPAPGAPNGNPVLFRMQLPASPGHSDILDVGTALSYGQLPASPVPPGTPAWNEWRGVSITVHQDYQAPASPFPPCDVVASVGQQEAVATAATPVAPLLGPATSASANGVSLSTNPTGVTTTPTLSWVPGAGVPTSYAVTIYALSLQGVACVATPVATLETTSTQAQVPGGILQPGATYFARITARIEDARPGRCGCAGPVPYVEPLGLGGRPHRNLRALSRVTSTARPVDRFVPWAGTACTI